MLQPLINRKGKSKYPLVTVARCLYVDIGIVEHLDLMEHRLTSIIACFIFNSPDHRSSTDGTVVLVYLSENSCITSALSSPCAAACVSVTPGAKGVGACYLLKQSCHCWAAIYIECFWSRADIQNFKIYSVHVLM